MKANRLIFIIIAIVFLIVIYFAIEHKTDILLQRTTNLSDRYNADMEIESARETLKSEIEAEIVTGVDTLENKISLTFDGLVDSEVMDKVLAVLNTYNIKGTFFIQGISAAEDEETIQKILSSGHQIGNFTLAGKYHMDTLDQESVLKDIVLSNVIIEGTTGITPEFIKFRATKYTPSILKISNASGINKVVKSDIFLSYQSFDSYQSVKQYINRIKKGSIVSIKMKGVLTNEEVGRVEETAPIEIEDSDKSIKKTENIENKKILQTNNIDIVKTINWLAKALTEEQMGTVFLSELSQYDDLDFEKNFKTEREENNGELEKEFRHINTYDWVVGYVYRGVDNTQSLNETLNVLKKKNIKASFIITGEELLKYPENIKQIIQEGHKLVNGGISGESMIGKTFNEVCFEIWKMNKLMKEKLDLQTNLYYPPYGKTNSFIQEACSTLNMKIVTYNKNPILDSETTLLDVKNYFKRKLNKGDIIIFNLDKSSIVDEASEEVYRIAYELGYRVKSLDQLLRYNSSIKATTSPVNQVSYEKFRQANAGNRKEVIMNVNTSQPAVAYVFKDINDSKILNEVLDTLDELNIKGSFFVTGKEIKTVPNNVREIVNRGHEIYNGGMAFNRKNPSQMTFDEIYSEIKEGDEILIDFMGDTYDSKMSESYMPLYADIGGEVLEAASSYGINNVVTFNRNPMKSEYKYWYADEIIENYFSNVISLHRGDIVYFSLNYFKRPNTTSDLISKITKRYVQSSTYKVVPINELLKNEFRYVPSPFRKNDVRKDTVVIEDNELMDYLRKSFIGTPSMNSTESLYGFSDEEVNQLNNSGKIDTEGEKVLFLTFDDWGSDIAITKLLNMLEKHEIKASFFVRVGNASLDINDSMNNPNLLRAIADGGHDIGNHTFSHMKTDIRGIEEVKKLKLDINAAKLEMERYIGETGALKSYFRPPTLAISKLGMEAILSCDYKYIVNGDVSSHDYEAQSAKELIDKLTTGSYKEVISNGSIIVMHMSDNSLYTAEALDTIIPYYKSQGYQFAKMSEFLK